jgi:hypothetical protein
MTLGRAPDVWSEVATYYVKGLWYFAAAITAALHDIQHGKSPQLILTFASIFFSLHVSRDMHPLKRVLLVLACLNPVVATQYTSFLFDGPLASLCATGILYSWCFFRRESMSLPVHLLGFAGLGLLFTSKLVGFAYGGVLLGAICLHRFYARFSEMKDLSLKKRLFSAGGHFVLFSLRLGMPVLLLVFILAFAPYVTCMLEGKHPFHPTFQWGRSVVDESVPWAVEAKNIYPELNSRLAQLLVSVASLAQTDPVTPAFVKNPFSAPLVAWRRFGVDGHFRAGGMGPLFAMLLLVSFLLLFFLKPDFGKGVSWVIGMIAVMIIIQPYAWQVRTAPFLWFLPFVCLVSATRREFFLFVPALIAAANVVGTGYFFTQHQWETNQHITRLLGIHQGETVLLDKSIFEFDGIFDRFDIRQQFANPETTVFLQGSGSMHRPSAFPGRHFLRENVAFKEDLPPLPTALVRLEEDFGKPWLEMSEGIALLNPEAGSFDEPGDAEALECWSYTGKIKFYMRADRKPAGDMELFITLEPYAEEGRVKKQTVQVRVNDRVVGEWRLDQAGIVARSVLIPRKILEESFEDAMQLLTLSLYPAPLKDSESSAGFPSPFAVRLESLEFRDRK